MNPSRNPRHYEPEPEPEAYQPEPESDVREVRRSLSLKRPSPSRPSAEAEIAEDVDLVATDAAEMPRPKPGRFPGLCLRT